MVSNFALLLVVFKRHYGSDGVNIMFCFVCLDSVSLLFFVVVFLIAFCCCCFLVYVPSYHASLEAVLVATQCKVLAYQAEYFRPKSILPMRLGNHRDHIVVIYCTD